MSEESRLDKTQGRGEESAATLQIIEINLNKLEPRTGTIEKRLQAVEQDLSTKVKPRFNVVDAKIVELQKRLKESPSEAQQTSAPTEVAETALSGAGIFGITADVEQLRLDFQDMLENLRGELSGKLEDRSSGEGFVAPALDEEQMKKLVEQLKNEMDEQIAAMNKNFNLFKEKVASKDELFEVLSKLKKLEERMTEAEKEIEDVKTEQK